MQRKELKKAIKKFSKKTNFYELGLIRKLLKYREQEEIKAINKVPKVICPNCGSRKISIEHSDSDYSCDSWLSCENCYEEFDDSFGFIDAVRHVEDLCWGYRVNVELHFEEPDIKSFEWNSRCRRLIIQEMNGN